LYLHRAVLLSVGRRQDLTSTLGPIAVTGCGRPRHGPAGYRL